MKIIFTLLSICALPWNSFAGENCEREAEKKEAITTALIEDGFASPSLFSVVSLKGGTIRIRFSVKSGGEDFEGRGKCLGTVVVDSQCEVGIEPTEVFGPGGLRPEGIMCWEEQTEQ